MRVFIEPKFWSDPDLENLGGDEKLALLWLITNSQTDLCGFCEVGKRRFEFETGKPLEALQRACDGGGKGFEKVDKNTYWIRNYVAYQMGRGDRLIRNNMGRSVVKHLSALSEEKRDLFLSEYPEIEAILSDGRHSQQALSKPSEGVPKGKEKEKEKEEGEERKKKVKKEAQEIYEAYPRKVSKPAALRSITKALKTIAAQTLLDKTKSYAKARDGADPNFTPHPATWFNGERFNDDPSTWIESKPLAIVDDKRKQAQERSAL